MKAPYINGLRDNCSLCQLHKQEVFPLSTLLGTNMEAISEQEAYFLVALYASEESSLIELRWEFAKWDIGSIHIENVIQSLIKQGVILITKHTQDGFKDYSIEESVEISKSWNKCEEFEIMVFLTEQGEKRWETDDWGITTKRAKHLMFSNPGKVTRVE